GSATERRMAWLLPGEACMSGRPVAGPRRLCDCVMPSAGAGACAVCRDDVAKSLNLPSIRILSTIERHNAFPNDPMQIRGGWELDIGELWSVAALSPQDVDFVKTYTDFSVIMMYPVVNFSYNDLGAWSYVMLLCDTL